MTTITTNNHTHNTVFFNDTSSLVAPSELRVAEMAGFDYIFAPAMLCDKFADFVSMQNFLLNAQAVFGSGPERSILIRFDTLEDASLRLDRYHLEWAGELLLGCKRFPINNTPQYDFIRLLLAHSEVLMA